MQITSITNQNSFSLPGIPTFNAGQLAAPGLPQAAPRSWYPCEEFSLEIDPESLNNTDDSEPIVIYDHYTLSQLQCLCRNEETWAQMLEWGYICPHFEELYFYHSDYLGHTEYITDAGGPALSEVEGYPYQYFYYTPFGESLITQHANTGWYSSSFRFNAKELDEETGNYYYGARYYNPKWSVWLGVDPLARQFPHLTPYNFKENNPIMLRDPDGRAAVCDGCPNEPSFEYFKNSSFSWNYNSETGQVSLNKFESLNFDRSQTALGVGGILLGAGENLIHNKQLGYWLDSKGNFNSYSLLDKQANGKSVQGVQGYRNGLESAKRYSGMWKNAGRSVFYLSSAISLAQGINHFSKGDYSKSFGSALDVSAGAVATFGGVGGLFIGSYYLAIDSTIGFQRDIQIRSELTEKNQLIIGNGWNLYRDGGAK